jgi:hypothetical protein
MISAGKVEKDALSVTPILKRLAYLIWYWVIVVVPFHSTVTHGCNMYVKHPFLGAIRILGCRIAVLVLFCTQKFQNTS